MKSDSDITTFGPCELDDARRELRVHGAPRHVSPRAFALLSLLVRERPRALSRDDLRAALWPETYVSNTSLAQLVTELRKAIGESARSEGFIRTVFGFGYAFAEDAISSSPGARPPGSPRCWLRHAGRDLALAPGPNVIGRGPETDVRLDFADVSRRHARIVVADGGASVEDLGSRNGTFVRGLRITSPVAVTDGDDVLIGETAVVFVAPSGDTTTRATRN